MPGTADANDLKDCSAMLTQSVLEVRSCKDLAEKRLNELTQANALNNADQLEINLYKDTIKKYEARIIYLESIKCTEFDVVKIGFFHFLRFKKCL